MTGTGNCGACLNRKGATGPCRRCAAYRQRLAALLEALAGTP